ncbi:hypothetical protein [Oerskovia turbata]
MVPSEESASQVADPAHGLPGAPTGRGEGERRRTVLALVVSLVLAVVLIGVVAVGIGRVVPKVPDRGIDLEATARRGEFLDALRSIPGVVYVVQPTDEVRRGGYDATPERIDLTVSGTPVEVGAVFTALCEHGREERDHGVGYVFDVATDPLPMYLQCEDPALAPRLAALVDLARATPAEGMGSVRVQVVGSDVSLWAQPAPEEIPAAWRWVSVWTEGVLGLGLTPLEVRFS